MGAAATDRGYKVLAGADSGYFFLGETSSTSGYVTGNHGNQDIWIIKTDRNGTVQWNKCFGGTDTEQFRDAIVNNDGTVTVFAISKSVDGDVSGNHGGVDIWMFKIDPEGNLIWQICLGGTAAEDFRSVDTLQDGSYVIAAYTYSNDGNVSGNHGGEDVWMVDASNTGQIVWQKCFGGTASEGPKFVKVMSDGNIIVSATASSSNGDVTSNYGNSDIWVIKLDNTGAMIWQKNYGSTQNDVGGSLVVSDDGNIVILGSTTGNDNDVTGGGHGYTDLWVIKINYATSALVWEKCIGGDYYDNPVQIIKNTDGDYLVASNTYSDNGDVTGLHGSYNNYDIFLVGLSDTGVINWSRCYGGTFNENVYNVLDDASSGEYLVTGYTMSGDGDVQGFHVRNPSNLADTSTDAWIVKIDYTGNIKWQKCLGGKNADYLYSVKKTGNNEFILAGETTSTDGDIQAAYGYNDLWAVKLGAVNTVKGTLFVDRNANLIKDAGEINYSDAIVNVQKDGNKKSEFPMDGLFKFETDTGSYTSNIQLTLPYYTVTPAAHNSSFSTYFNTDSFSFALQPIAGIRDLAINTLTLSRARIGFDVTYKIFYKNLGTDTVAAGNIFFKKDSRLDFVSSVPAVSSLNGDTLEWNYADLMPLDTSSILVTLHVQSSPAVNIGDTLISVGIIDPSTGDQAPNDDTITVKQIAVAANDPNTKAEDNSGVITPQYIVNGKYLDYIINFQNTGTDIAYNITIRDTLSDKLDWSTLQMTDASHPCSLVIEDGNKLAFTFYDIRLPDSTTNETGSHGYVAYRIKPKSTLVAGDSIPNLASIYFDFNLPVETNNAYTIVVDNNMVLPVRLVDFSGTYKNGKAMLFWTTADESDIARFEIERSTDGLVYTLTGTTFPGGNPGNTHYNFADDLKDVSGNNFYYRLKIIDRDDKISYSRVLVLRRDNRSINGFTITPNPAINGQTLITINSGTNTFVQVKVMDNNGRALLLQQNTIVTGNNTIPIKNMDRLPPGVYILQIISDNNTYSQKFELVR